MTAIPNNPRLGRTTYIGGSDAAAILGQSRWRTPYQLWCEKSGIEVPPDLDDIDYIYFGTLLEPVVAQVFQERTNKKIRIRRKPYRHKQYPFLGGHIDRLVEKEKAFLECKTANAWDYSRWGRHEEDETGVPEYYVTQCDHYMMVGDFSHCYLAALIGGNDFRCYTIKRNATREKLLLKAELEFWERVKKDDPPDIDNETDAKHRWKNVLPDISVPVSLSVRKKIVALQKIVSDKKALETKEKEIRDEIFPIFEDKEYLSNKGEVLARLTTSDRKYFNQKLLEKEKPKVAAKYTETRTSKRLSILI